MPDESERETRKPTRLTEVTCEHPYESTTSTPYNGGRDIEIQCGNCNTTVRIAVYRVLIARDLAIWGRRQVRQSGPPGSPDASLLLSSMSKTPEFGPDWPTDYPSPRLRP